MNFNGHSLELGRILGELVAQQQHHGRSIERQNSILLDIKDSIQEQTLELTRLMIDTRASARPPPHGEKAGVTPGLHQLITALMPLAWFLIAVALKLVWPEGILLLREFLGHAHGGMG